MTTDIIVPVYQVKPYLEKSIKSLLTNTDAQIIIIDNGSTDGSGELADSLAQDNERISVFHQENKGVSAARNKGLELAKADYIAFADPDDFTDSGYYNRLLAELINNNADLALGRFTRRHENGSEEKINEDGFEKLADNFKDFSLFFAEYENSNTKTNSALMGSVWRGVFKRDIIENNQLRFNDKIALSEDLFFVLSYLNCCKSICTLDDYGYYYNVRSNSASAENYKKGLFNTRLECIAELKKILDANDEMAEDLKQLVMSRAQYTFAYECISNEMRFNKNGAAQISDFLKQGFKENLLAKEAIALAEKETKSKKIPLILKLCRAGKINAIKLLYSLK